MHEETVYVVASVLVGGVLAQWLGWRLRIPAIVFLLAGGLLAGPITGALDPDHTFGDLLFPSVSLAVAVILFEGALGLGWKGVRGAGRTVWLLLTVGAAITLVGTAISARFILDIDWKLAILLAAVLVVTGPTVIGPIVRSIGLHGKLGKIAKKAHTHQIDTVLIERAHLDRRSVLCIPVGGDEERMSGRNANLARVSRAARSHSGALEARLVLGRGDVGIGIGEREFRRAGTAESDQFDRRPVDRVCR